MWNMAKSLNFTSSSDFYSSWVGGKKYRKDSSGALSSDFMGLRGGVNWKRNAVRTWDKHSMNENLGYGGQRERDADWRLSRGEKYRRVWMCVMHESNNTAADGGRDIGTDIGAKWKEEKPWWSEPGTRKVAVDFHLENIELIVVCVKIPRNLADMSGEAGYCSVGRDGKGNLGLMSWPIVEEIGTKSNFKGGSQREGKAKLVLFENTHVQLPCYLYNLCVKCQHFVISKKGGKKYVLFELCDCLHEGSRNESFS